MVSSPSPPDPYEQANAQFGSNMDSAVVNAMMNNMSEQSPLGSITYNPLGTKEFENSQGNVVEVPQWERIVTLSEDQQAILDAQNQASQSLLGIANEQLGFLGDYLGSGVDTSQLPDYVGPIQAGTLDNAPIEYAHQQRVNLNTATPEYAKQQRVNLEGQSQGVNLNTTAPQQGAMRGANAPQSLMKFVGPMPTMQTVNQRGSMNTDLGNIPALRTDVTLNTDFSNVLGMLGGGSGGGSMQVQTVDGNIADAGNIQRNVNLTTQGGDNSGIQRNYDGTVVSGDIADAGNIVRDANLQDVDTNLNFDGPDVLYNAPGFELYNGQIGDVGDIQRSVGVDDYSSDRTRVEDAIMSRYNRQFAETESALDQKLRNQGLMPGTEAYDRQFRQMREMQTDAMMQSILAGGQEQSRLFGLDLASGQFANQAQQQAFNQEQARGMFGLNVNQVNNAAALAAAGFSNQAQQQGFNQAIQAGQYGREGIAQNNATALAAANFANAAQGQQFGQNQAQTQMDMSAAAQNNALAASQAAFANQAQQQNFAQQLANAGFSNEAALNMANFANAAQQQQFGQNEARTAALAQAAQVNNQGNYQAGSLANQAAQIQNQYALGAAGLALNAQQAQNQALMQEADFYNNAVAQNVQNQINAFNFENQATLQNNQLGMSLAGFNNQAGTQNLQNTIAAQQAINQAFTQEQQNQLQAFGFNNALTQQQFQNQLAGAEFANQAQLQNAGFNNDALQQNLQNQLAAAGFNNAANQQDYQNALIGAEFANQAQLQNAGFNNAAGQADFQNALAAQNAYNQNIMQQFNLDNAQAAQANNLRQTMLNEQYAARNQPINEIAALMSGSQLMMPQFAPAFQTGLQPVPIADYMQQAYENEVAAANSKASGLFGILGAGMSMLGGLSDRRTKRDIRRLGSLPNGVPVYEFRYIGMDDPQVGVMADEVEHIPDAVNVVGGLKMVNYGEVISHAG